MSTDNTTPLSPAETWMEDNPPAPTEIAATPSPENTMSDPELGADIALDDDAPAEINLDAPKVEAIEPTVSKQDVEFRYTPYSKPVEGKILANPVHSVFPSDTRYKLHDTITQTSNADFSSSAGGRQWAGVLLESMSICPADDVQLNALERPASKWRQAVQVPSGELIGTYAKFKARDGLTTVSGDSAVIRMQQHLSLGTSYRIPLWNTGIWITFRAPSEPALMELERQLTSDKIELGRASYGLTYSNTTAIFNDRVVSFAMEQIWNTSLKAPSANFDLREIISNHDIPALLLGLAAAIWPDGFNHSRSCIADPDKCTHTIEELIHIPKTLLVDTASLTVWQTTHMANNSNNVMTLENVKRYQDEMVLAQAQEIVLAAGKSKEVTMQLRVPSVVEFISAGNIWINEMVKMVDDALGREVTHEKRNQHIMEHGKATNLRQYGQWVRSIRFGQETTDENDRETINALLGLLSQDDELRVEFMTAISKYIAASTITVVGVPSFVCPNCQGVNRSTRGHPTIVEAIPYDPLQVFFDLIAQRVQRISER